MDKELKETTEKGPEKTRKRGIVNYVRRFKFRKNVEVNGINFTAISNNIRWRGKVNLHITGESDDGYLSEMEFPKKNGKRWYVEVTTGLLFDKQTGACRQSTHISLDLTSVESVTGFTAQDLKRWVSDRRNSEYVFVISTKKPKFSKDDEDDVSVDDGKSDMGEVYKTCYASTTLVD